MNSKIKKKIIGITLGLITAISSISVVSIFININNNYAVIKGTNKCRNEIKEIHNDYVKSLYNKIQCENGNKSLEENAQFYNEILEDCKEVFEKETDVNNIITENKIEDVNMNNYIADTKTFAASVEKVYELLEEGSEGNFEHLNNLSEEDSKIYVNNIKLNYEKVCSDYKKLKLED